MSGTDGVGTKLKLAFALDRHDTIGIDLVAMSVNDILVQGAEPLFFLDYFACERLDVDVAADVIKGIAAGCEQAGCALIGGETAEHPDAFVPGEYDLAGFAVGVVEKSKAIDGRSIVAGDVAARARVERAAFERLFADPPDPRRRRRRSPRSRRRRIDGTRTLGEALLAPTRIYVKPVLALLREVDVKGMAHITGGGLVENTPRMFPDGLRGAARRAARGRGPPIFDWLQRAGNVADAEMHRVFNCGIGMVVVVAADDAERAQRLLAAAGERVYRIGVVVPRATGAPATVVV